MEEAHHLDGRPFLNYLTYNIVITGEKTVIGQIQSMRSIGGMERGSLRSAEDGPFIFWIGPAVSDSKEERVQGTKRTMAMAVEHIELEHFG